MNEVGPGPALTTSLAVSSALAAGFAHLALTLSLVAAAGESHAVVALAGLVAYGAFFALLAARLDGPPAVRLGFVRPARGSALACLLLLPSVLLVSEIDNLVRAAAQLPAATEQAAGVTPAQGIELALVFAGAAPLMYGVFFRGLLQPVLVERLGSVRGVLACSVLEACAGLPGLLYSAFDWPERVATAALLGTLRQCSGSLLPALLLHAAIGAVGTAAQFGVFGIAGFDDLAAAHTPPAWLAAAAASTALGLWVCHRLSRSRTPEPT
jgi:hypothetical protein